MLLRKLWRKLLTSIKHKCMLNRLCRCSFALTKMNEFSENSLKVDYTTQMDKFSPRKDDQWISFLPTVLAVVIAIARGQVRIEIIIVDQHGYHIEVGKHNQSLKYRKISSEFIMKLNGSEYFFLNQSFCKCFSVSENIENLTSTSECIEEKTFDGLICRVHGTACFQNKCQM